MSHIGKKPLQIPQGVTVNFLDSHAVVTGPKGELELTLPAGIMIKNQDATLVIESKGPDSATYGRVRAEIANAIRGVSTGWSKNLEVVGTGYRASSEGNKLTLYLGFSHPVEVNAPAGINFTAAANKITVAGVNRQLIGQVAARIRSLRPPDHYKGKGIRYEDETVRKKQGKAAKGMAEAP